LSLLPRAEIRDMAVCPHGGIDYAEMEMLGIAPEDIIDFSANLNAFGPPPELREALSKCHWDGAISHYPDSGANRLKLSLARKLGIKAENILISGGSTELIRLVALTYFSRGDRVLIVEPTYGEYQVACQIAGASLIKQQLSAVNGFLPEVDETIQLMHRHHPKGVFICNPNNPTGRYMSRADFRRILDASLDSLVILDEAYISFVDSAWSSLDMVEANHLLIIRSMTKDYSMAGLRLGYGVAGEEIITDLRRVCPPWNVNVVAQEAGIIAIEAEPYLKQCQARLRETRRYLTAELSNLGLPPVASEANFFLVEVGGAALFRRELLKLKILVRDCSSFGLPAYIRIAPRTLPECQMLVVAVKEVTGR
jgi:histidinol-phosphate aminotransferase